MSIYIKSFAIHLSSKASITKLGSFLFKAKIDKLLQLWNVLKGEVNLVGLCPIHPIKMN